MTLVGSLRARRETPLVRARAAAYAAESTDAEREAVQLELLNASWSRTIASVPVWSERVRAGVLPDRFTSLEAFVDRVPVTNRAMLQTERTRLESTERPSELARITGGSTAEPVQIAAWRSEFEFSKPDMWLARSWYGIAPDARLFLLWGHSHLLGSGWRGWLNAQKRRISDRLLGYHRFSAYDLRPETLRRAGDALLRFRPDFVIGYSVALDLFASANLARRAELRAAGVKLVLAAAEGFPSADSASRLRDLFGCSVGMEYGAVETSLVAHTHPEGGYRVFWRSYLVDAERIGANHRLRVTSLYPRRTPLVRYELGDEVEPYEASGDLVPSLMGFERVIGRCNDFVVLEGGFTVHSEAFTHAVRTCHAIRSFQVVQEATGLRLLYTADEALGCDDAIGIRERLGRIHARLASVPLEHVPVLQQTVAGKTPMVLRR